jgi:hypothetical protein
VAHAVGGHRPSSIRHQNTYTAGGRPPSPPNHTHAHKHTRTQARLSTQAVMGYLR